MSTTGERVGRLRSGARLAAPWLALLLPTVPLAAACQPVETAPGSEGPAAGDGADGAPAPGAPGEPAEGAAAGDGAPRGAPGGTAGGRAATTMPQDLGALLGEHASTAAQWQDGAVPVEVVAGLDDGAWTSATVLYVAPDADRVLLVTAGEGGSAQQRPTLETLGLAPISAEGVAQILPLPELSLPPEALAAAAAPVVDECGASGPITAMVYATGAPASWDGRAWTEPPVWTVTVSVGDGAGAVVDPVTAEPAAEPCVAPS